MQRVQHVQLFAGTRGRGRVFGFQRIQVSRNSTQERLHSLHRLHISLDGRQKMATRELRPGTRVRLKTRTMNGWQGEATIVQVRGNTAVALRDDFIIHEGASDWVYWYEGEVEAALHEWVVMRDQTPNPDHVAALPPTYH